MYTNKIYSDPMNLELGWAIYLALAINVIAWEIGPLYKMGLINI